MKIIIEEYAYDLSLISPILSERYYVPLQNQRCKVNYIGYYFEPDMNEPVMILPKVFIENNRVFGKYSPEDIFDLDHNPDIRESLRKEKKLDFLFSITTWHYLAIRQFQKRQQANTITESSDLANVISTLGEKDVTELDLIQSIIRFNRENQALFTFIKKTNSAQNQQVSWHKTIAKKMPTLQNGSPVYVETLTKQKTINYDEELLVILSSVLSYFNKKYYFQIATNQLFTPYKGRDLENLMKRGTVILKQIKYKYFSDKLLKLWDLLYAYFLRQDKIKSKKHHKEIVLVRDFNIVFEDMIDTLLSEPNLPSHLKNHKDGKEIDHIYPYQDLLTSQDQIYHIGDSKYYKDTTTTGQNAIAKQYTYAKNVIQYNIDVLNKEGILENNIRYRDELTEGYNITPNFFISAVLNDSLDFQKEGLEYKSDFKQNNHFKNRLFDRDTLILQTYNINFLFVLNAYVANNQSQRDKFKGSARSLFRKKIVEFLDKKYNFYTIKPEGNLEDFVVKNFRFLSGKMYRPSGWEDRLLLAFEKGNDNEKLEIVRGEISEYRIS
ncbi:LlaJI restriction endonuclease [Arcicella aurantiaca]|uniref:LlaJI restriction endonuclease n=1 Tax=Arcicella aurantiaca TaxID=591202 RepID=A0A316E983_9BACT|nr:LlaJI family restriction endonuclease [Arcicella aurantiaca]PWK19450.1 LlaJI restriction endonuclease [Arcicella aurantiaca]